MKKVFVFLTTFLGGYAASVAAIWGLLEAYSFFKGDSLKLALGPYWFLIYGAPLLIMAVIAAKKTGSAGQDKHGVTNAETLERIWAENILPRLGSHGRRIKYLEGLELKIREMPFIYKGLEGYVMNDFVNVVIQSLDYRTLKVKPVFTGSVSTTEKLRNSKKVILLGGGGIGKTTFQRHTILEILKGVKPGILHPNEKVIPIYVPLKAVDNSSAFPILRYILNNTSLLPDAKDLLPLIRYGETQKLFLFLDGYDEIQFAGGGKFGKNYVREELDLMFSFAEAGSAPFINYDSRYQAFYASLKSCRIWLSSRKEFFEQHPVFIDALTMYRSSAVWAVELTGIGDNRVRLIDIIFNKYRKQSEAYAALFNAEYFIQEIDESSESEIHQLSYNPLFLTIMCYIYARKVVESGSFDVKWGSSFNELIWECVRLLIRDLDESKARDLPEVQKIALLRRRNAYNTEKEAFLLYFSAELFVDEQNIFTLDYIKEKVREFFNEHDKSSNGDKIIRELDDDSTNQPNFALQLIFAGIFIIVDKTKLEVLYDYPHRRFREVLASKYFIEHGHQPLLDNLERQNFSELIYVFFNVSSHQNDVLSTILDKTKSHDSANYCSSLAINCLNRKPQDYDPNDVLHAFFLNCLTSNEFFNLSPDTLGYFKPRPSFLETLSRSFKESLDKEVVYSFALSFDFLLRYNEPLLKELAVSHLGERLARRDEIALLLFLKHKELYRWFSDVEGGSAYLDSLHRMKELFQPIRNKNSEIPYAEDAGLESCYIITEEVLKDAWQFLKDNHFKGDVDSLYFSGVEPLQYNVFFHDHFLQNKFHELRFDGTIDHRRRLINAKVKAYLIERSRVNYQEYRVNMKLIESLNPSLQKISFFSN